MRVVEAALAVVGAVYLWCHVQHLLAELLWLRRLYRRDKAVRAAFERASGG